MRFAKADKALGICDRCGLTFKLASLTDQVIDRRRSGIMVCARCLDIDQEQLQVGKLKLDDPLPLKSPRPDTSDGREPLVPYVPVFLESP